MGYTLTIAVYAYAFGHYLSFALVTSSLFTRLFATAAAINSTLFSTSNQSRRVAEDGEPPRLFEYTNSRDMPARSILLMGGRSSVRRGRHLSTLAEAASLVFLFTFGSVNYLAARYIESWLRWPPKTAFVLALPCIH